MNNLWFLLILLICLTSFCVCMFIHIRMKNRVPKNVWDFIQMVTLPLVLFNIIRDGDYYKEI